MKQTNTHIEINNLLEVKKYDQALPLIDNEIINSPNNFLSYYYKAMHSLGIKSYAVAIENLLKASELDKKKNYPYQQFISFSYMSLADISINSNNYDEAESLYNRSLDYTKDYVGAYHGLGSLHFSKNDFIKSEKYYKKALTINPNFYLSSLGLAYVKHSLNEIDESINYAKECLKLSPNNFKAHFLLGLIYFNKEELDLSLSSFQESQLIDPKNESVLMYIINCHILGGNYDQAYSIYSTYIEDSKIYSRALYGLRVYLDFISDKNTNKSLLNNATSFIKTFDISQSDTNSFELNSLIQDNNIVSMANAKHMPTALSNAPSFCNYISTNFQDFMLDISNTGDSINQIYPKNLTLSCFKVFDFSSNNITPLMDAKSLYNAIYLKGINENDSFDINFALHLNNTFKCPESLKITFNINKNCIIYFPSFFDFSISEMSSSNFSYYIVNFCPQAN